jgi:hypothetical protein
MVSWNDVESEANEKYGPFVLEDVPGGDVTLRNIIRLTKNERQRVSELNAAIEAAKGDTNIVLDSAAELLKLVAVGDGGTRLIEAMADDPPKIISVLNLYTEATQLGEALPSGS